MRKFSTLCGKVSGGYACRLGASLGPLLQIQRLPSIDGYFLVMEIAFSAFTNKQSSTSPDVFKFRSDISFESSDGATP